MANYDQYGFNKDKSKYDLTQISSLIKKQVDSAYKDMLAKAWPVGSIFLSVSNSTPAQLGLPGTWVELPAGYYLSTQASYGGSTVNPGSTGGKNSVTLATANIPPHAHKIVYSKADLGGKLAPFKRVRFIDYETGGSTGKTPAHVKLEFRVRRGYSASEGAEDETGTTLINETGMLKKYPKNQKSSRGKVEKFNKAVSVQDQGSENGKYADLFTLDLTDQAKLDGYTSDGIYNQAAYEADKALDRTAFSINPLFIRVRAWRRKS